MFGRFLRQLLALREIAQDELKAREDGPAIGKERDAREAATSRLREPKGKRVVRRRRRQARDKLDVSVWGVDISAEGWSAIAAAVAVVAIAAVVLVLRYG